MLRQWQLILPPVTLESLQTPLNISHFASQGILWHIRKFPKLNQSSAIKTNFSMIIFQIYWCHLSGHIINIILIDFLCPDFINVNINKTNVHLMYHWQGCQSDMSDNVISRVRTSCSDTTGNLKWAQNWRELLCLGRMVTWEYQLLPTITNTRYR